MVNKLRWCFRMVRNSVVFLATSAIGAPQKVHGSFSLLAQLQKQGGGPLDLAFLHWWRCSIAIKPPYHSRNASVLLGTPSGQCQNIHWLISWFRLLPSSLCFGVPPPCYRFGPLKAVNDEPGLIANGVMTCCWQSTASHQRAEHVWTMESTPLVA